MRTSKMSYKILWNLVVFHMSPWGQLKCLTRSREILRYFKCYHEDIQNVQQAFIQVQIAWVNNREDVLMGTTEMISKIIGLPLLTLTLAGTMYCQSHQYNASRHPGNNVPTPQVIVCHGIHWERQGLFHIIATIFSSISSFSYFIVGKVYSILYQSHFQHICFQFVFELTKHNPYLTFKGELWGLCHTYILFRKLTVI